MAVKLLDAARNYEGDKLRAGVLTTLALSSEVLQAMPFINIEGTGIDWTREDTNPAVGFRGVNEAFSEDAGNLAKLKESLKIAGGDLDVDKFIVKQMGERQRAIRTALKVKSLGLSFVSKFIKGDETSDKNEFDGLQTRLGSTAGDQVIDAGATSGGDALSLAILDSAVDAVDNPTHLIMSKELRRRFFAAARNTSVGGDIHWEPNEFGKRTAFWGDLPIIVADEDETGTKILPFTEANPGGGAAASTSIYVVSFGEGSLSGFQANDPVVADLGELDTKPVYRTRLEWYVNFAIWGKKGAARLQGIKDAAIVA